ncbi:MAG: hypothetical protein SFV51_06405 [Bryobacteraceae bacterium]|nr:hypothetical protein [Bryobacteraceae bacterium]
MDRIEATLDRVVALIAETARSNAALIAETARSNAALIAENAEANAKAIADATAESAEWRRQHEIRMRELTEIVVQTAERQSHNEHELAKLREALEIDAENIRRLANIAVAHETRLDDLEGGQS